MKLIFEPKAFKPYKLSFAEIKEQEKFIEENLRKGYIKYSKSPMASPFFFVAKKDGKLRLCQDYRYLNKHTIRNAYLIPNVQSILNKSRESKYFTAMDVRLRYNNIRIRKQDRWKGAFRTNQGLFEPTVMFFRMCNSLVTFQTMMNTIFAPLIAKNLILVYIDDILIHAPTKKQLHKTMKEVLKILQEHDLYLKPEKCQFAKQRLSYLGYIISPDQVQMDLIKLKGISDWPAPSTIKETRKFLGFCNFYRKFIKDYAKIASPINQLVKKNMKFIWTEEAQKAFDKLKKKFEEKPILITPDPTKPFKIFTDASNHAIGAVLTQRDNNGVQHPCFFYSKPLSPVEKRYHTSEQEFLAIIRAIQE